MTAPGENLDFIQKYLSYIGRSESPNVFHRWSAIGGLGTWLGKSVWFEHGVFKIYPNLYIQLFGVAGSRKSTAIKRMTGLLRKAGYKNFSAEKISKEKFIEWMSAREGIEGQDDMWASLIDDGTSTDVLIAADEFNDFFGANILDFMSFLGVMWDYDGNYEFSTRSAGSVTISNPCVNILSGNTPTMLASTVPPEAIGQGFFSRTLIIHGEETGIKIAFPEKPPEEETEALTEELLRLRSICEGRITALPESLKMLETIYEKWERINDPRFDGYGNRRFSQLLKLCIIHAIADKSNVIRTKHVIRANTVLFRAERDMPKALGEFGTSRNAAAINKIFKILEHATKPMTISELWGHLHNDLDRLHSLSEILMGLNESGKIQVLGTGILLKRETVDLDEETNSFSKFLDWEYLTPQEREFVVR